MCLLTLTSIRPSLPITELRLVLLYWLCQAWCLRWTSGGRCGRRCGTCVSGAHGKGPDREIDLWVIAYRRYFVSRDWMRSPRNWVDRDEERRRAETWGASTFWDSASDREPAKEVENYLAIKRNEVLIHTIIWMNIEKIMLSERGQPQKATFYMIPFI